MIMRINPVGVCESFAILPLHEQRYIMWGVRKEPGLGHTKVPHTPLLHYSDHETNSTLPEYVD